MRPAFFAALVLALTPVAACGGQGGDRFDLICRGQMTRNGVPAPFETRLHVDLTSRRFCLDACLEAFHLSEESANLLAYTYDIAIADADHAANRFRGVAASSAGPYPLSETITVDRRNGVFRRDYRYDQGDPADVSYDDRYVGQCSVMPYTGLAARAG